MRAALNLLREFDIQRGADYGRLHKRQRWHLCERLYELYKTEGSAVLTRHRAMDGVRLLIDTAHTNYQNFDIIAKKCILYGTSTVIRLDHPFLDGPIHARFPAVRQYLDSMFVLRHIIERENLHVFPDLRAVTRYWRDKDPGTDSTTMRGIEETETLFELSDRQLASVPIYLRQAALVRQVAESAPTVRPAGASKLYLPYLRNVPSDVIMALKDDNRDLFDKFQDCLSTFLAAHRSSSGDRAIAMMKKVDEEVRDLEEKFQRISKQRALEGFEVSVGLLSVLLCMLLPAEVAKVLVPILGTASAMKGLTYLRSKKVAYFDIERSSYYIPWRLSQPELRQS